ncbi:MAG TPA: hypothetical protein VIJ81_01295 [Sphingomicrobium sp.]
MIHRPILMSLLGWITIIVYGFGFLTVLIVWDSQSLAILAARDAIPLDLLRGGLIIECAALTAAGMGILRGLDWSRYVFVGVQVADELIDYLTGAHTRIGLAGAALLVATTIYLFRPAADEWFSQ